jgi:alkylhydroperoxidase family enzyme
LTREPGGMDRAALDALRAHGLDDAALHEAAQIVAYFNYINRVADALNVDLEPEMPPAQSRRSDSH